MLDVGWTEILVIAIVLIIVVGPKDLPQMLRTFGRMVSKIRGMAGDFRQQFDEALREADLDDVRKTIGEAQKLNPLNSIRDAVNPLRQVGNDIKADLQKATSPVSKPTPTESSAASVLAEPATPAAETPEANEAAVAAPVKKVAARKTAKKASAEDTATAAKPRKAAAKVDEGARTATRATASGKKSASAKSKTTKTRKDEA